MSNLLERAGSSIKEKRIGRRALISLSGTVAASAASTVTIETAITSGMQEMEKVGGPMAVKLGAVAVAAVLNGESIRKGAETLRREGHSATPGATFLNALTKRPFFSSAIDAVVNYVLISVVNPINARAIQTADNNLLVNSLIASFFTIPILNISLNRLILSRRIKNMGQDDTQSLESILGPNEITGVSEPLFTIANTGNLTPGLWVNVPRRNQPGE